MSSLGEINLLLYDDSWIFSIHFKISFSKIFELEHRFERGYIGLQLNAKPLLYLQATTARCIDDFLDRGHSTYPLLNKSLPALPLMPFVTFASKVCESP